MERITERHLQAQIDRLARNLPGRPFTFHTESGLWIADEMMGTEQPERWRIRHRLVTCTTKRELFDWLYAFNAGVEYRELYAGAIPDA